MSVAALLAEARAAGVTLRLVDGAVKVGGAPSPEFLASLRAHKSELASLLWAELPPLPYPPDWQGWPDERSSKPIREIPNPATAPIGKCLRCRFTAPLSPDRQCGKCIWLGLTP